MTHRRIALFENIHPQAVEIFRQAGFKNIKQYPGALEGALLIEVLKEADIVGIRSKTQLTADVLKQVPHLQVVGCFCIGTDQVALKAAQNSGIAVFNAPYANTRSVAELVIGEIIMLMRGITDKNMAAHQGKWIKSAEGASEVRGKTLGIVGYGHIGTQLSVLAEALGMRVIFYDVVDKLSLGNAVRATSLNELLAQADVVSLHVPATKQTENMIGLPQLQVMKKGAILLNAARGNVVDLDALAQMLRAGHIGGAAIDVFPVEPAKNGEIFSTPIQNLPNVILTPHIGGSTIEAQENIAFDVAEKLIRYALDSSTAGSVNIPQVSLPDRDGLIRFAHLHHNQPGVLSQINNVFSSRKLNIAAQYLQTDAQAGYVVVDIEGALNPSEILKDLRAIPGTIRAF